MTTSVGRAEQKLRARWKIGIVRCTLRVLMYLILRSTIFTDVYVIIYSSIHLLFLSVLCAGSAPALSLLGPAVNQQGW